MTFWLAAPWLLPFLSLFRLARRKPNLSDITPAPDPGPPVSVVIPARNEAETIETVVRSVLATGYSAVEVLVVDDRSTDGTSAIVERLAAADPRLRLVRGAELPAGWYGKPWACVQGAQAAAGRILVFTDADTRHHPELLGRSVAALEQSGADLLTVAPRQACLTFWERLVMPQLWVLLGLRYHPSRVNRARKVRDVIANGQFIMLPRESYLAMGTHEAVKHEVAEDLALAQRCWSLGRRLYFVFAEQLMETRMYRDLPHLIEGWSKNIFLGGRRSFPGQPLLQWLVPPALAGAMVFWLLPVVILLLSLSGAIRPTIVTAAAIAAGASVLFWTLISAGMRIPAWYGFGYPLGALMALYIVLRSAVRGSKKVEWKGRVYDESVNRAQVTNDK